MKSPDWIDVEVVPLYNSGKKQNSTAIITNFGTIVDCFQRGLLSCTVQH